MKVETSMSFEDKLYHVLVNRVPGIREKYRKSRGQLSGIRKYAAWCYLVWLNISYYVFRNKKLLQTEKYPYYENKVLYTKDSESSLSKRESPEELAAELAKYDVISFDVFDTLILRPFSSPTDLFFILGDQLNYMDFQRIRCEMEWRAREKKYKKEKHHEVNLDEIYTILAEETGIDKEKAMALEINLEYTYCFANPYMFRVVKQLLKLNKKIIITSDMYLNTQQIKELLRCNGYPEFASYYVSCDMNKSKSKGDLFDAIKKKEGLKQTYAHVGDNYLADVKQAKKHGFTPCHYYNVNAMGMPFRADDMSVITGGLYRGIINAHIHNGLHKYSREYEYGFIYGGLFVTGYCQFIHEYVNNHDTDKILFLARDGDILSKAYVKMYPHEQEKIRYVYWSRLAAVKMSASYFKYDFFRRFLYHKVNQKYTFAQIFEAMELDDMLSEYCEVKQVKQQEELTDKNVNALKIYLQNSWERVLKHYEEQLEAGKKYFSEILKDCRKVIAVDIGWAGSGAIALNYIINNIWNLNCSVVGIIAGTNSCHNSEPDFSETFLQTGKMASYLYSQRENRDIWKKHDPAKGHNIYWEMLLDAPSGSFKGFYFDNKGECIFRFKEINVSINKTKEIQTGILDFIKQYKPLKETLGNLAIISGRDAYAPMINVESELNLKFVKAIEGLADDINIE
ncbi:MAG: HAD family hydrolase [Lachnospiraceae bacterium]